MPRYKKLYKDLLDEHIKETAKRDLDLIEKKDRIRTLEFDLAYTRNDSLLHSSLSESHLERWRESSQENDHLWTIVEYFLDRHSLTEGYITEDEEGNPTGVDLDALYDDVVISQRQSDVTAARKNLGFKS